jgi:hypothetical protein
MISYQAYEKYFENKDVNLDHSKMCPEINQFI